VKKSLAILFTIAALLLQGCGSVSNLASKEPANYGGVQKDIEFLSAASNKPLLNAQPGGSTAAAAYIFVLALIPTELALSLTIDTLALPYTIRQNRRIHQDDDRSPKAPAETVVQVPSADGTRLSTGD
jgi:uncharacterized protein YceK